MLFLIRNTTALALHRVGCFYFILREKGYARERDRREDGGEDQGAACGAGLEPGEVCCGARGGDAHGVPLGARAAAAGWCGVEAVPHPREASGAD